MKNTLVSLSCLLSLSAFAEPLSLSGSESEQRDQVQASLEKNLVPALETAHRFSNRYSRARLPSLERRVHTESAARDAHGATFFTFTIDTRRLNSKSDWREAAQRGCFYPASGETFMKAGDTFIALADITKRVPKAAAANTCEAAGNKS